MLSARLFSKLIVVAIAFANVSFASSNGLSQSAHCIFEIGAPVCARELVFTRADFAVEAQRIFGLTAGSETFFFPDLPASSPNYGAVQATAPS